ncbi:LacI family DNA-binding transcriptional regulator [Chengkuizengella axinellae]|uniref:LacI family DNA-binding transcriptional regulator n=1 Tax=Chengkuizengella axinellae TaxID=3064388 RepID=A0ABT9IXI1_9BACL|nr:LacI family DNA-binding transcriptional regulator [Chengkuizengella sp. 2205SS18-9]MDP5274071.1 LacI family DNA-binding transcriptional regulator [Chengkuizengella sp. 2205SS18-9]
MKPTIYDIAREAGVSIATVSKVINNTGRIGDKTKQKVMKVMKELDYQPSIVASALTGKRTHTIGLLIPDIANPFFAEIARSVEDMGNELGFSVMMCSTDNNIDKESKYISLLEQKRVDGIIIATGTRNTDVLQNLLKKKLPIALIARDLPSLPVDTVLVDDYMGGYEATSHLISLGHQKISIIAEDLKVMSSKERIRGYRQALEDHGMEYDEEQIHVSDFTIEGGREVAATILAENNPATAIFACNDLLAMGVIQAAREIGVEIPSDLSIIGFDNTILASLCDPPLTTIAQPIQDMGKQVVELLVKEIKQEKQSKQRVVLMPSLEVRNTTSDNTKNLV